MPVLSGSVGALDEAMTTEAAPSASDRPQQVLPFEAGDAEWAADLVETMRRGDVDAVREQLEQIAVLMRKAAKARRMLASLAPEQLQAALIAHARRGGAA